MSDANGRKWMQETQQVLSDDDVKTFLSDGFLIVENFLSESEADSLRLAVRRLINNMNPDDVESKTVFKSNDENRNKYFVESGDKVSFFFEEEALDKEGRLKVDKHLSLNKIGHSLHWLVPEFKKVSFSDKVKSVAKQLTFVDPAIVQSMFIFKQPNFGGEVVPHKDCTFLSTTPETCIGLWFALEDATLDNGCLWFWPGSHQIPTQRRFERRVHSDGIGLKFTHEPDEDQPSKYQAAPVKKGSLVIIHGEVTHKSSKNCSEKSRNIYTFHIIEQKNSVWSKKNWLQPTEQLPFTSLYQN